VFAKFPNALIAAGDPIELPAVSEEVDYEGELAVVIGRRCKDVAEADALDAVAGYMPFNDVSARDIQLRTSQWISGKALDTSGPSGPALVLRDEVPDPQALRIVTTLNGEVLQESSTDQMIFPVRRLVAYISALMTLEPGDVIATGTPAGVGFKRTPPIYLRAGDTVQVAIDGLGTLENPVVAPRAAGTLAAGTGVSA
jgi:2-keto-4-pentenoate hydratase/2-oxohepta-3-ene-1,7-dioic acid hydratase in catechol pathway